eukprot:1157247-Pelagomonas_calceolata.AAC.17
MGRALPSRSEAGRVCVLVGALPTAFCPGPKCIPFTAFSGVKKGSNNMCHAYTEEACYPSCCSGVWGLILFSVTLQPGWGSSQLPPKRRIFGCLTLQCVTGAFGTRARTHTHTHAHTHTHTLTVPPIFLLQPSRGASDVQDGGVLCKVRALARRGVPDGAAPSRQWRRAVRQSTAAAGGAGTAAAAAAERAGTAAAAAAAAAVLERTEAAPAPAAATDW